MKLEEALKARTVPDLLALARHLPTRLQASRKAEIVAFLVRQLTNRKRLEALLATLTHDEQLVVADTLHDPHGDPFRADRFAARYARVLEGPAPKWTANGALALFLHRSGNDLRIPRDLAALLEAFVQEPDVEPLAVSDAPGPDAANRTVRQTEAEALLDVSAVLRLVQAGRVRVAPKTGHPNPASQAAIAVMLANGDFYDEAADAHSADPAGPIKSFAWPLLLQAGGLASMNGGRLQLTRAGERALTAPPQETLRRLWERWLPSRLLDEFNRVDRIRGQRTGRALTAAAPRRKVLAAALADCPVGRWVAVEEFARYLQAEDFEFEVARDPWALYVCEREYGALGFAGHGDWPILQGRYLRAFLFEYAATLGLVDVAYVHPIEGPEDYRQIWGTDDYAFLSRYDGLEHFRLTALGAWCLGKSEHFAATASAGAARLEVLPSRRVRLVAGELDAAQRLQLDAWAEREGDAAWKLTRETLLDALERGLDPDAFRALLASGDEQPLPEPVDALLTAAETAARALRPLGPHVVFECADEEIAERITPDRKAGALCRRAGTRLLLVEAHLEARFRTAVRGLGLGAAVR